MSNEEINKVIIKKERTERRLGVVLDGKTINLQDLSTSQRWYGRYKSCTFATPCRLVSFPAFRKKEMPPKRREALAQQHSVEFQNTEPSTVKLQIKPVLYLVFSPQAGFSRNQSSVRRPVWLWKRAFWASS
jgi:hypothetical protein